MNKQCTQCKGVKELDDFYKKNTATDGRSSYCKVCYRKYSNFRHYRDHEKRLAERRDYYRRNKDKARANVEKSNRLHPNKNKARIQLRTAVYKGLIKKLPCEVCGKVETQGHHHKGYDKPLEVQWLCAKHHGEAHSRLDRTKLREAYTGINRVHRKIAPLSAKNE